MGVEKLEENLAKILNDALISCEKCRLCNTVCPVLETRITQGSFGMNRAIYYALKWNAYNEDLRNLIYSCTTCGKCTAKCADVSRGLPLVEIFEKARELLLVEKMLGPMPDQVPILKNLHLRGNPWGYPSHERTNWSREASVKFVTKESNVDVLYFVGCATSYDPKAQNIAKNLSRILAQAGVNFGILSNETSSGHEARRMGETGLFQYLSDASLQMFQEAGIKHIVTGDPHDFYTFTHEYPDGIKGIKIQHYVQFLNELIEKGQLKLGKTVKQKVTYHDPCYLGRHSELFDEPRRLIRLIPGVSLVEMENSRADSDCCGMGGGRMWTESSKEYVSSQKLGDKRLLQAVSTGAEILLTACPFCLTALSDSVPRKEKEDAIKVMDITELIIAAI